MKTTLVIKNGLIFGKIRQKDLLIASTGNAEDNMLIAYVGRTGYWVLEDPCDLKVIRTEPSLKKLIHGYSHSFYKVG